MSQTSPPTRPSASTPWQLAVGLLSVAFLGGCAKLEPFEEVVARLPADEFIKIKGQRVHVRQWGSSGRPILLLHGFGASAYTFRELGPLLGETRRVVAVDLNGFGYTERPEEAESYSFDGQLDMVRGVMQQLGMQQPDIVGHSYSGYLAMRLAETTPDQVGRLVLISPALEMQVAPDSIVQSRFARAAVYPLLRGYLSSPRRTRSIFESAFYQKEVFSDEVAAEYRRRLLVEGLGHAYRGFGANLNQFKEDGVKLGSLKVPVMVLAGRHDQIIPLETTREQVRGSGTLMEVLENSGHSSPEEQPEEVASLILDFVSY